MRAFGTDAKLEKKKETFMKAIERGARRVRPQWDVDPAVRAREPDRDAGAKRMTSAWRAR